MRQEQNIDRVIKKIESLPTLPVISQKIMELAGNENSSFKDLVSVVEKDHKLAIHGKLFQRLSFHKIQGKN